MGVGILPFEVKGGHSHQGGVTSCPVFKLLPAPLQGASKENGFLLDYVHLLPVEEVGIPEYHSTLDRSLGDKKNPNLIYPIENGLFVHIYPDPNDSRDFYIAIEPGMLNDDSGLVDELEDRLVDYVEELEGSDDAQRNRGRVLHNILNKAVVVVKPKELKKERKNSSKKPGKKMLVSRVQFESLRYLLVRDKEGMGVLEPLISDPYLEDISCSGVGSLFLEHKIFKGLKTNITFDSMDELDTFVIQISEKIGKPVTYRNPIVDATLPDGSRINIVLGGDVSKRGSNFTIRKFAADPLSLILRWTPSVGQDWGDIK